MQLLAIHPNRVWVQWELFGQFVSDVCNRHPAKFSKQQIGENVAAERWQLWMAWDDETQHAIAVCATELCEGQDGKVFLNFLFCTGRDMRRWVPLARDIIDWAKRNKAERFEGLFRPGWERVLRDILPGLRRTHVMLEKEL